VLLYLWSMKINERGNVDGSLYLSTQHIYMRDFALNVIES